MRYRHLMIVFLAALTCHAQQHPGFTIISDIDYYQGPGYDSANHKLNLVIPEIANGTPLLVWIGGGAWSKVNRQMEMDLAKKLAQRGITVATVGHRLSTATWSDSTLRPGIKHPQHITDVARAVKYLYQNTTRYKFSPEKIFIGGFSSGAQLAALISMDKKYLEQQGLPKDLFKGVVPISGTFDIPHYHQILSEGLGTDFANRHIESVFGLSQEEMRNASATTFLQNFDIPMLLISDRDMLRYHLFFEEQLREAGIRKVQAINLLNYGHGELWKHLSYDETSRYRELMIDFILQDCEN